MTAIKIKKPYKKIALTLSLCALILWSVLGTGASLAWFSDTTPEINNIFHFADFDLDVYHRLTDGKWEEVDGQTKIFDEKAIYEPGYVQVAYLKVVNQGDVPFKFKTAVNVNSYTLATNVFGQQFNLQDHLQFGLVSADTFEEMCSKISDREATKAFATLPLNHYDSDEKILQADDETTEVKENESYVSLIVYMPEEVGNIANYREDDIPEVDLGIIVKASQLNAP